MSLANIMAPDWAKAMEVVEVEIHKMGDFLRNEAKEKRYYLPFPKNIFNAFYVPLNDVKVLIVGQDPYPNMNHPIGLAFAVNKNVKPLPPSLVNIYKELKNDLGINNYEHGDLTNWTKQGVMLLNRVLTVRVGIPNSHKNKGWEKITETAIKILNNRDKPLVAILWGNNARTLKNIFTNPKIKIIESAHPSPLSAQYGFFGSEPFSKTNNFLLNNNLDPIDWHI
jgi:uracil-DNA glycosylase